MSRRYESSGNGRPWQFSSRPLDASLRRQMHGPIRPMQEPGFFAKLFGWRT